MAAKKWKVGDRVGATVLVQDLGWSYWLGRCDCGNERRIRVTDLANAIKKRGAKGRCWQCEREKRGRLRQPFHCKHCGTTDHSRFYNEDKPLNKRGKRARSRTVCARCYRMLWKWGPCPKCGGPRKKKHKHETTPRCSRCEE